MDARTVTYHLLHGCCPRLSAIGGSPRPKSIFPFKASASPAEADRPLGREHLTPRIARVTLPERSVTIPSSLVVIQASRCPARSDVTTH